MKILIISHNPLSTYQNMGKTMLSLFHAFDKNELCQLYIYPSLPDVDSCKSFFRITDKDILRSYYKFKVRGKEVFADLDNHNIFENPNDEKFYRNKKNNSSFRMIIRDLMWKFSKWYNKNLCQWIRREAPDIIFIAPGASKFIYNIALKISKIQNVPIVTYICDDYYFVIEETTFFEKKKLNLLKRKIEQLLSRTRQLIVISKGLELAYGKKFKVPCKTIMTGSNYPIAGKVSNKKEIRNIIYMGNIGCNRFNSLSDIGEALDEINIENKTDYKLNIYTGEKDKFIINKLKHYNSIQVKDFVAGEEFKNIFHSADMLLHVEAFDKKSIDLVKYSVSTKIADSLGSGICLFAYGPACVSSMKHLIENDCAVCAVSKGELKEKLLLAFNNRKLREEKAYNALTTAHKYHDENITSREFHFLMEKINENTAN